ncbi:hypothetical protein [Pseudoduganella lutea]|uniref:Uncharacterized protein n=1 Tax=Pseudoduganella lutea TaxID=321985 RepID=A0A4P6L5I9_9BURK|nr:hypothetical protein [Pseudoduganella lutea]QBE66605.1 hypothetical protein EWM63_29550 [Pseudoduganella lutea]
MTVHPFADLEQAGIIDAAQHMQALAHPQYRLLPTTASATEQVSWLVEHDIIDDEDLERARAHIVATQTGEDQSRYTAAIDAGLAMFVDDLKELNSPGFDVLVEEGLITPGEREAAMAHLGQHALLAMSPAGLVLWMRAEGIIDNARLAAIGKTPGGGSVRGAAILAELDELTAAGSMIVVDTTAPRPSSSLPWLFGTLAVCGMAAGLVGWLVLREPAPPAAPPKLAARAVAPECTDKDLAARLNARLVSNYLLELGAAPAGVRPDRATLEDIREVGYERARDVRACAGKLRSSYGEQDYAFTLEPDGENDYMSIPVHPVLLHERYRQDVADRGSPLGRTALDEAFRAGIERWRESGGGGMAWSVRPSRDKPQPPNPDVKARRTWERSRTIAEIEPLAPCVALKPGKTYRCTLMIERHNGMGFASDDGPTRIMQGEFTFERAGEDQPWQTTAKFPSEYGDAVLAGMQAEQAGN